MPIGVILSTGEQCSIDVCDWQLFCRVCEQLHTMPTWIILQQYDGSDSLLRRLLLSWRSDRTNVLSAWYVLERVIRVLPDLSSGL